MNSQMQGAQTQPLTQVEAGVQRVHNLGGDIQQKIGLLEQRLIRVLYEQLQLQNPPAATTGHGNLSPLPPTLVPLAYDIEIAIGTLGDCQSRLQSILERLEL